MKSKLMISAGVCLFFLLSFINMDINKTIEKEDVVAVAGSSGRCDCWYTDGGEVERTRCGTCFEGNAYGTKTTCGC